MLWKHLEKHRSEDLFERLCSRLAAVGFGNQELLRSVALDLNDLWVRSEEFIWVVQRIEDRLAKGGEVGPRFLDRDSVGYLSVMLPHAKERCHLLLGRHESGSTLNALLWWAKRGFKKFADAVVDSGETVQTRPPSPSPVAINVLARRLFSRFYHELYERRYDPPIDQVMVAQLSRRLAALYEMFWQVNRGIRDIAMNENATRRWLYSAALTLREQVQQVAGILEEIFPEDAQAIAGTLDVYFLTDLDN